MKKNLIAFILGLSLVCLTACGTDDSNDEPIYDDIDDTYVSSVTFNYNPYFRFATNDVLKIYLDCDTDGASIAFALDDADTYELYEDCIRINQPTTIHAYAYIGDAKSVISEASFEVDHAFTDISECVDEPYGFSIFDGSYTFADWDDHLICHCYDFNSDNGYLVVYYESCGENPQINISYVNDEVWNDLYNCIACDPYANQMVLRNEGYMSEALYKELHFMGQDITITKINYVPDNGVSGRGDYYTEFFDTDTSYTDDGPSYDDDPVGGDEPSYDDNPYAGSDSNISVGDLNNALVADDDYRIAGYWYEDGDTSKTGICFDESAGWYILHEDKYFDGFIVAGDEYTYYLYFGTNCNLFGTIEFEGNYLKFTEADDVAESFSGKVVYLALTGYLED